MSGCWSGNVTSLLRVGALAALAVVAAACDSQSAGRREQPVTTASVPGSELSVRWAETMSGPSSEDEFDGVAASPDGSVYVTGKFERSVTVGGVPLESAGAADIPFARFDSDGRLAWAKRFGGPGEDNLFDVDANGDGAVATGSFSGTVAFGSTTLTSSGPWDCVIVALAPDGQTRWARAFGGPGRDGCNEVTVRRLIFDVNDFDETLPGPWEWDLKRLGASFAVAARAKGLPDEVGEAAVLRMTLSYAYRLAGFATTPTLDAWYWSIDTDVVGAIAATVGDAATQSIFDQAIARAHAHKISRR
jgi:Uncharacterized protein conserved in bacteria (DUF2252)